MASIPSDLRVRPWERTKLTWSAPSSPQVVDVAVPARRRNRGSSRRRTRCPTTLAKAREALHTHTRTATRPIAMSTSASHSADSAPSSGSARRCCDSSITRAVGRAAAGRSRDSVRRRSSRAGVLSRRCATLSRQHAAATSSPAGRIVERVDEVAGERREAAPREREPHVVVKPPARTARGCRRARGTLRPAPAGSAAARRSRSPSTPIATAPTSPTAASAISVRSAELRVQRTAVQLVERVRADADRQEERAERGPQAVGVDVRRGRRAERDVAAGATRCRAGAAA